jgi:AcrR family transcriptional regulator
MATGAQLGGHPGARLQARTAVELPPNVDHEGTRGRILRAALELFAHVGFHGASIRAIADAAGMQTATMYGQFLSKDAMLEELMVAGHEAWGDAVAAGVEEAGPTPAEQLVAMVRTNVLHHIRYAMVAVVSNGELHSLSAPAATKVIGLRRRVEDLVVGIIDAGVRDGSFAPQDPAITMLAIGGMSLRVANWYPGRFDYSPEELADRYAELILRMVGATA